MGSIGNALQGAAGGALAGGALGPVGALGGGILGGLGGLMGGSGESPEQKLLREQMQAAYGQVGNRPGLQLGPAAQAGASGFAPQQQTLADMLFSLSNGTGPSLAGQQLQQGLDRATGSQAGMAAGAAGRGINPGAAFLTAANNSGALGAQANQDAAMARTQEQLGAMSQLGSVLQGARGQDQQQNQWNAGAQNDQAIANIQSLLQQRQLDDTTRSQLLQLMMSLNGAPKQPSVGDILMGAGGQIAGMDLGAYAKKTPAPGTGTGAA